MAELGEAFELVAQTNRTLRQCPLLDIEPQHPQTVAQQQAFASAGVTLDQSCWTESLQVQRIHSVGCRKRVNDHDARVGIGAPEDPGIGGGTVRSLYERKAPILPPRAR